LAKAVEEMVMAVKATHEIKEVWFITAPFIGFKSIIMKRD